MKKSRDTHAHFFARADRFKKGHTTRFEEGSNAETSVVLYRHLGSFRNILTFTCKFKRRYAVPSILSAQEGFLKRTIHMQ